MKPLVSILIPAFNAEKVIAFSIRSALQQTWERKEIIVVDDGSSDDTCEIAKRFSTMGNVRVVREPHQGASAARNAAIRNSRGDFIQWLDADDFLGPDKISRQLEQLGKNYDTSVLLSSAWGYFLYRPKKAVFSRTTLWRDLSPVEWLIQKFEKNLFMQTSTWLVSRHLTEVSGPWDERLSLDDDGEYFARVLRASTGVKFVEDAKTFYRRSGATSLSDTTRARIKLDSQFLSMQLQIGYLQSMEESTRTRHACLAYLQHSVTMFYQTRPDIVGRLRRLIEELGGELHPPQLPPKYAWLQALFGWPATKSLLFHFNNTKWGLKGFVDKALFLWESRCCSTEKSYNCGG